jgi:hypothetical protein
MLIKTVIQRIRYFIIDIVQRKKAFLVQLFHYALSLIINKLLVAQPMWGYYAATYAYNAAKERGVRSYMEPV